MSRRKVEKTAEQLVNQGFPALPYHAGLSPNVRANNHARFQNEDEVIMVATIACGMAHFVEREEAGGNEVRRDKHDETTESVETCQS